MDDYNKMGHSQSTSTTRTNANNDNCSEQQQKKQKLLRYNHKKLFKLQRQGPCFFGHTTTSAQVWTANPDPSFWKDVPIGCTACQRCDGFGYRAKCQGRNISSEDMGIRISEPSQGQHGQARTNKSLSALGHKRNKLDYFTIQGEDEQRNSNNNQQQQSPHQATVQPGDTTGNNDNDNGEPVSKRRKTEYPLTTATKQLTATGMIPYLSTPTTDPTPVQPRIKQIFQTIARMTDRKYSHQVVHNLRSNALR